MDKIVNHKFSCHSMKNVQKADSNSIPPIVSLEKPLLSTSGETMTATSAVYKKFLKEKISQLKCTLPNITKPYQTLQRPKDKASEFSLHYQTPLSSSKYEDYSVGSLLGEGAYAEVREVLHKPTNNKYAFKIYNKFRLLDSQRKTNLLREIHILEQIDHTSIIRLYQVLETDKSIILVLELVTGESLKSKIKNSEKSIPIEETVLIFKQICNAIGYLHSKLITHRDLKLENILINEQSSIKIIDFGFSVQCNKNAKLKLYCGTPSYMCPEIMNKKEYLGPPVDVWAAGVILYVLSCGTFPFKSALSSELHRVISKGIFNIPSYVPVSAQSLIKRLLIVDPAKRLSAQDILLHSYFNKI